MPKKEINIASAEGFKKALRHPDASTRTAILRAIMKDPDKALSVGKESCFDLVDELITLCEKTCDISVRSGYVHALLNLDDERCIDFAKQEFLATDDSDIILLAAGKLAKLSSPEGIAFLSPVISDTKNYTKSRAAANLLAHHQDLSTKIALRVAMLSDHNAKIPSLNMENLPDWLDELQGPYPYKTRRMLLNKSDNSFTLLLSFFDRLPHEIRLWAFQEAVGTDPGKNAELIKKVISQEEEMELLVSALEALQHLPPEELDEKTIAPYYRHKDAAVRSAAINAGVTVLDWNSLLKSEVSDTARLAIIARIGKCKRIEDGEFLASLLEDKNWRIRSRATGSLVSLAPASLPILQRSLSHSNDLVKASAVKALKELGMDDWIEEYLCKNTSCAETGSRVAE